MSHQPSPPRRRGPIARVLVGAWHALDFSRRLVFNLLFLLVVLLVAWHPKSRRRMCSTDHLGSRPKCLENVQRRTGERAFATMSGKDPPRGLRDDAGDREGREDERIERVLLSPTAGLLRLSLDARAADAIGELREAGKRSCIWRLLRQGSTCARRPTRSHDTTAGWGSRAGPYASTTARDCRTSSARHHCSRSGVQVRGEQRARPGLAGIHGRRPTG